MVNWLGTLVSSTVTYLVPPRSIAREANQQVVIGVVSDEVVSLSCQVNNQSQETQGTSTRKVRTNFVVVLSISDTVAHQPIHNSSDGAIQNVLLGAYIQSEEDVLQTVPLCSKP